MNSLKLSDLIRMSSPTVLEERNQQNLSPYVSTFMQARQVNVSSHKDLLHRDNIWRGLKPRLTQKAYPSYSPNHKQMRGNIFLYVQDIKAISFYSKSQQKNDSLYAKGFSDQTMRFPEREGLYVHYEVCLKKKLQEKCTYPAK